MVLQHDDRERLARYTEQVERQRLHRERWSTMMVWASIAMLWWFPMGVAIMMYQYATGAPYEAYAGTFLDLAIVTSLGISFKLLATILTYTGCSDHVQEQMAQLKFSEYRWRYPDTLGTVDEFAAARAMPGWRYGHSAILDRYYGVRRNIQ